MTQATEAAAPVVVLLHGLARTPASLSRMAAALRAEGFRVVNVAYPSRHHPIEVLAREHVAPAIARGVGATDAPVHFVTHSLGGIIVRQLAAAGLVACIGRVVMLSPPNQGSEIVDKLGGWRLFQRINGPAGNELGTSATALPRRLGAAPFEAGVITGDRSVNWLLSTLIPGANDGKVSLDSARLAGMASFLVLHATHPFIMRHRAAIAQTAHFLRHGAFAEVAAQPGWRWPRWPITSPRRTAPPGAQAGLNCSPAVAGNSITTVEPSRNRPISSPRASDTGASS
jgi:triacylglycerol lipase